MSASSTSGGARRSYARPAAVEVMVVYKLAAIRQCPILRRPVGDGAYKSRDRLAPLAPLPADSPATGLGACAKSRLSAA